MAYNLKRVLDSGGTYEGAARYLSEQYGYDLDSVLQAGGTYEGAARYLAAVDPHTLAVRFFQKNGWSPEQAAGIVGNLSHESTGMNPVAQEKGGKGWGLAQWTSPDRVEGLRQFAAARGEDTPSFMTQLQYVQHELSSSEAEAGEALRGAKSVADATKVFSELFERPGKPNMPARLAKAASLYQQAAKSGEGPNNAVQQPQQTGGIGRIFENVGRNLSTMQGTEPEQEGGFVFPSPESVEKVRGPFRAAGMIGGGVLGAPAGGVGGVAGAGLGSAIMDQIVNMIKQAAIARQTGQTVTPTAKEALVGPSPLGEPGNLGSLGAAGEGVLAEAGGQAAGKVLAKAASGAGGVFRGMFGASTGAGSGAIEEAVKSGESLTGNVFKSQSVFDRAMRGKISPEEVVSTAKEALGTVKEARGAAYLEKLREVQADPRALDQVQSTLRGKIDELTGEGRFDISFKKASPAERKVVSDPDTGLFVVEGKTPGTYRLDFSSSPIIEGRAAVRKALHDALTWEDTSAAGLDVLKKRLSTYVSQARRGTPAHALLTDLENTLSNSLKAEIPNYAEMTKGYSEVTKLIKDVESNLMLRSEGMSGRITADQTLRRLSSSMKDNFELRKSLVEALSSSGGEDVTGAIAGYLMKSPVPHGLRRTMMVPEAAAVYLKPELWPVLVSSSPRVVGEFLRLYGRALSEVRGLSPTVGKGLAFFFSEGNRDKIKFPRAKPEEAGE